jgi:hypothetical protein
MAKRNEIQPPEFEADVNRGFNHPDDLSLIEWARGINASAEKGSLEYFEAMVNIALILAKKKADLEVSPQRYLDFAACCRINKSDAAVLWRVAAHASLAKAWGEAKIGQARDAGRPVPKLSWQAFWRDTDPDKEGKPAKGRRKADEADESGRTWLDETLRDLEEAKDELATAKQETRNWRSSFEELTVKLETATKEAREWKAEAEEARAIRQEAQDEMIRWKNRCVMVEAELEAIKGASRSAEAVQPAASDGPAARC